jgi:hypothetical protein
MAARLRRHLGHKSAYRVSGRARRRLHCSGWGARDSRGESEGLKPDNAIWRATVGEPSASAPRARTTAKRARSGSMEAGHRRAQGEGRSSTHGRQGKSRSSVCSSPAGFVRGSYQGPGPSAGPRLPSAARAAERGGGRSWRGGPGRLSHHLSNLSVSMLAPPPRGPAPAPGAPPRPACAPSLPRPARGALDARLGPRPAPSALGRLLDR